MRGRSSIAVLAAAILALAPLAATAQRLPGSGRLPGTVGGRGGDTGNEGTTRRIPEVDRQLKLMRSRFSYETYPFYMMTAAASLPGGGTTPWSSEFGQGGHIEYRIASPRLVPTLDLMSSYLSTSSSMFGLELGGRYRPSPNYEQAVRPYVDLRGGYQQVSGAYTPLGSPTIMNASLRSRGFQAIVGTGAEMWFASKFGVTAGVAAVHSSLTSYNDALIGGSGAAPSGLHYGQNSLRFTVGLLFNNARAIQNASTR
jgi:hypothetical protein